MFSIAFAIRRRQMSDKLPVCRGWVRRRANFFQAACRSDRDKLEVCRTLSAHSADQQGLLFARASSYLKGVEPMNPVSNNRTITFLGAVLLLVIPVAAQDKPDKKLEQAIAVLRRVDQGKLSEQQQKA